MQEFTSTQQTILDCVAVTAGEYTRSGLAKLLAGSTSRRLEEIQTHPYYGRLRHLTRKQITSDIDILMQQGYLIVDRQSHLAPAPGDSDPPLG